MKLIFMNIEQNILRWIYKVRREQDELGDRYSKLGTRLRTEKNSEN